MSAAGAVTTLWVVVVAEAVALCAIARAMFAAPLPAARSGGGGGPRPGEKVPRLELASSSGERIPVGGPCERPQALLFLEPTSPTCRLAMLWLDHFIDRQDCVGRAVVLGGRRAASRLIAEASVRGTVLLDPSSRLCRQLRVERFPTVVLIDRWGRVAGTTCARRYEDVEHLLTANSDLAPAGGIAGE